MLADTVLVILTSKQHPIQEVQGQLFGMSHVQAHTWSHGRHPVLKQEGRAIPWPLAAAHLKRRASRASSSRGARFSDRRKHRLEENSRPLRKRRLAVSPPSACALNTRWEVKRDRIGKDTIRLLKDGMRDAVMETWCGLHNFRLQDRPWHYAVYRVLN